MNEELKALLEKQLSHKAYVALFVYILNLETKVSVLESKVVSLELSKRRLEWEALNEEWNDHGERG